jgi:DNA-binding response OmpR family regulator
MLTTSERDEDIVRSYKDGACSFVTKPVDFRDLQEVTKHFALYWALVARLPSGQS